MKRIQNLPKLTRSDMVKGLLGFTSIEAYIDMQKLLFLGYLCRLQSHDIAFKVFIQRLYQHKYSSGNRSRCFIKDITNVLNKYGLQSNLDDFIRQNTFPSKLIWKKQCRRAVLSFEENKWRERISLQTDFQRFKLVHRGLIPSLMWRSALDTPNHLETMNFVIKLLCKKVGTDLPCPKCGTVTKDEVLHVVFECDRDRGATALQRYLQTVSEGISSNLAYCLYAMDKHTLLLYALGRIDTTITTLVSPDMYKAFLLTSGNFLKYCYV